MKKKPLVLLGVAAFLILCGCSSKKPTQTSTERSIQDTSVSTTETKEAAKEKQPFDKLSQATQIVLYADTVDNRVRDYPGLEGLLLSYQMVGNDLYFQISSGAGSGHPVYHLAVDEQGIRPLQAVSYMGAANGYEEVAVTNEHIAKDKMFQAYEENQANIDKATQKVEASDNMKSLFEEQLAYVDAKKAGGALWDANKSQKLATFMADWGQRMDQSYKQYSPTNNVDLYGLMLPAAVLGNGGDWQAAIGDNPIQLQWSETGATDSGYALVAVYSDAESQPYLKQHVYFFTLRSDGTPSVLVTMQNQGNEFNYLYFNESENAELVKGFADIVAGN
ncbi:DUF4767 domain-containing protein [Vagococcus acidifermentans]|nr:DUF4767 domain-containing protein [Vagococcus acidifermentans]